MNTLKWLMQREFWEHKGAFLWTPAIVGGALVSLAGGTLLYKSMSGGQHSGALVHMSEGGAPPDKLADILSVAYMALAGPVFLMMALAMFFYAASCLYDERRDRSILFWKSLPVSDGMTVLSKALSALVVMPVLSFAAATLSAFLMVPIVCTALAMHGVNITGRVFSTPALYIAPLQLLSMLPVFIIWALPTLGWLMLVSSWARSKALLWAVGLPLLAIATLKMLDASLGLGFDVNLVIRSGILRALAGFVPGIWFLYDNETMQGMAEVVRDQGPSLGLVAQHAWRTLATPAAWGGALAGLAMLAGAVRLRRYRDDT
ncbi:hypothetical protein [Massilia sp. TS11]|uniref:hypothetical protein n=1 Tax=Massilia sp. TS11 TaxID=2908003 RepID=UPI001EDB00C2|nr:hypothetical protein [Massilia sp. TS11]MCG2584183.1 hypothetical protein [Massilia sp. TS11]